MLIHIHVYKIAGKAEVDIKTENEFEAKEKALAMMKQGSLKTMESDCEYIAMVMGAQGEATGDVENSSLDGLVVVRSPFENKVVIALKYLLRQQLIKTSDEMGNYEKSRGQEDVKKMLEELEK